MAGAPRLGKMSTCIRRKASREQSATARTATTMVTGRRMAERTSHITQVPLVIGGAGFSLSALIADVVRGALRPDGQVDFFPLLVRRMVGIGIERSLVFE